MHSVAMEQRRATRRVEADDVVEVLARERPVGPRALDRHVEPLLLPGLRDAGGDDVLGQDVEGPAGVERASRSPRRTESRSAAAVTSSSCVSGKMRPFGTRASP